MPRTPTGQRPHIDQRNSAGWSWPRLRPINEQQSRASMESIPAARTAQAAPVHDDTKQDRSPTNIAKKRPADVALPQSPGSCPADSASPRESSAAAEKAGHPTLDDAGGRVSPTSDTNTQPLDVCNNSIPLPGAFEPAQDPPDVVKKPDAESSIGPETKSNETSTHPSATEDSHTPHSMTEDSVSERLDAVERPDPDVPKRRETVSTGTDAQPSAAGDDHTPEFMTSDSVSEGTDAVERAQGSASERRGTKSSGINTKPLAVEEDRTPQSTINTFINEATNPVEESHAHTDHKRGVESTGDQTPQLSIQGSSNPQSETNDPLEGNSTVTSQPQAGIISRRGTNASKNTARGGQGAVDELPNGEARVTFNDEVNPLLNEDKPNTPTTTPLPSTMDRVSVPTDPTPYYATPKIMLHKPSQSSQSNTSGPRTIDEVLAREREGPLSEQQLPSTKGIPEAPVPSVMPRPIDTPTGPGVHRIVRVKRRNLYMRKARNAAARKTILKMTLGRQLAGPTKQALRQLANGETIIEEPPVTP